jgi:hypothetical protein
MFEKKYNLLEFLEDLDYFSNQKKESTQEYIVSNCKLIQILDVSNKGGLSMTYELKGNLNVTARFSKDEIELRFILNGGPLTFRAKNDVVLNADNSVRIPNKKNEWLVLFFRA